jgi:hypothetical protein
MLVCGSAVAWLLAAMVAYGLGAESAIAHSAAAFLLCLLPTSLTLAWSRSVMSTGSPEGQLLAVLGGTGVRLLFAVGGALVLFHGTILFHERAFWQWVVGAYLVTLGLEVGLVVRSQNQSQMSNTQGQ